MKVNERVIRHEGGIISTNSKGNWTLVRAKLYSSTGFVYYGVTCLIGLDFLPLVTYAPPHPSSSVFRVRANSVLDLNSPGNCIGLGKLFLKLITPIFGFPVAQKICSTIPDGVNFRQVLVGLSFPGIIGVPALVFFSFPFFPSQGYKW